MSNAGSVATPIGNPQNILITRSGELDFLAFVKARTPPTVIALVIVFGTVRLVWQAPFTAPAAERIDAKADPLVKLNVILPWADCRPQLAAVWHPRPVRALRKTGDTKRWVSENFTHLRARQRRCASGRPANPQRRSHVQPSNPEKPALARIVRILYRLTSQPA